MALFFLAGAWATGNTAQHLVEAGGYSVPPGKQQVGCNFNGWQVPDVFGRHGYFCPYLRRFDSLATRRR